MATLRIKITELEKQQLGVLAAENAQEEEQLLRSVLSAVLTRKIVTETVFPPSTDQEKLARLQAACGMWADHPDLPEDLHAWRKQQERSFEGWG